MWVVLRKFVFFDFDFRLTKIGLGVLPLMLTLLLLTAFVVLHVWSKRVGSLERVLGRLPLPVAALVCFVLGVVATWLWPLGNVPVVYFQF
jgi:hypothetical protein